MSEPVLVRVKPRSEIKDCRDGGHGFFSPYMDKYCGEVVEMEKIITAIPPRSTYCYRVKDADYPRQEWKFRKSWVEVITDCAELGELNEMLYHFLDLRGI